MGVAGGDPVSGLDGGYELAPPRAPRYVVRRIAYDHGMGRRGRPKKANRGGPRRDPARVFEFGPGFRVLQQGRNVLFDNTGVDPGDHERFREGLDDFGKRLPRLIAEAESKLHDLIGQVATAPLLAHVALRSFEAHPNEVENESAPTIVMAEWLTRACLSLPQPVGRPAQYDLRRHPALVQEILEVLDELLNLVVNEVGYNAARVEESHPGALPWIIKYASQAMLCRGMTYDHVERLHLGQLFDPFSEVLRTSLGYAPEDVIAFRDELVELLNARLAAIRREARGGTVAARRFVREQGWTGEAEKVLLASYIYEAAGEAVTFKIGDLAIAPFTCRRILAGLSLTFGMKTSKHLAGRLPEIVDRPLVMLDDERFLGHLAPVLLESGRAHFENALKALPLIWPKYEQHRAKFVESRTADLFRQCMPQATVWTNLTYADEAGRRREVDVAIEIGRLVMAVECKSALFRLPTNPLSTRVPRDIKHHLQKAEEQLAAAARHIAVGRPLQAADGTSVVLGGGPGVTVEQAVVALDPVVSYSLNSLTARTIGVTAGDVPPWIISLADLEAESELSELNAQLWQYVSRRRRVVTSGRFDAPEELDWFLTYLKDGLYFADDLTVHTPTRLMSFTEELTAYYLYRDGVRTRPAAKPRLSSRVHKEFWDLLASIERSDDSDRIEVVRLLLDISDESQRDILEMLRDLRRPGRSQAGRWLEFAPSPNFGIAIVGGMVPRGEFAQFARNYALSRLARSDADVAVSLGVHPKFASAPPRTALFRRSDAELPTVDAATAYLDQFRSLSADSHEEYRKLIPRSAPHQGSRQSQRHK